MSILANALNANSLTPFSPTSGGTGVSDPTAHGILVAEGSSAFSPKVLTNGQLLIGSTGADPVAASLTAGSGVTITPGAGSITIAASGGGASNYIIASNGSAQNGVTGSGTSYATQWSILHSNGITLPTNSTFLMPANGYYLCTAIIPVSGITSTSNVTQIQIQVNGGSPTYNVVIQNAYYLNNTFGFTFINYSTVIPFSNGDNVQVKLRVLGEGSDNINIQGDGADYPYVTFFQIA